MAQPTRRSSTRCGRTTSSAASCSRTTGTLALIVLSLDPKLAAAGETAKTIAEIRKTVHDDIEGTDLQGELSGVPVMQLEIRNAVERDRVLYNAVGFAAGCLIAILFFRRLSFMMVAAGPPLIAILLALGTLGWLDFRLNMFLNVMTPLIMVISFSDSMQLTFAARDRLIAGKSKREAFPRSGAGGGARLRADARDRGAVVHGAAVHQVRSDQDLRRSRPDLDRHRAARGADPRAGAGACARAQRRGPRDLDGPRRHGRPDPEAFLRLDRVSDGEPCRGLQPGRGAGRGGPRFRLFAPAAELSPRPNRSPTRSRP